MIITDISWRKEIQSGLGRALNVDVSEADYPWMARTRLYTQKRTTNADGTTGPIEKVVGACVGSIINYSRYIQCLSGNTLGHF